MKILLLLLFAFAKCETNSENIPMVINTWAFVNSTTRAWDSIKNGGSALDAVEIGCKTCEELQCDGTVGFGGGIDENGETTLDAMIMDGKTLNVGAVAGLRRVKKAISVARHVLQFTKHSLIVGDLATKFAVQMGFQEESLSTKESQTYFSNWKINCQPNFWVNVLPNPTKQCGPYSPFEVSEHENDINYFDSFNHDTIGMIAIDVNNNVAAGTSTNGAKHKIPGRVGDSPIPGAGAYADNDVGAAVATGDGDVMLRLLPSFLAVEQMRIGKTPTEAATLAIKRITKKYPSFFGGVVAVNKLGEYGAGCHGMEKFPISFRNTKTGRTWVKYVNC